MCIYKENPTTYGNFVKSFSVCIKLNIFMYYIYHTCHLVGALFIYFYTNENWQPFYANILCRGKSNGPWGIDFLLWSFLNSHVYANKPQCLQSKHLPRPESLKIGPLGCVSPCEAAANIWAMSYSIHNGLSDKKIILIIPYAKLVLFHSNIDPPLLENPMHKSSVRILWKSHE